MRPASASMEESEIVPTRAKRMKTTSAVGEDRKGAAAEAMRKYYENRDEREKQLHAKKMAAVEAKLAASDAKTIYYKTKAEKLG
jgi:hypothetical protein